MYSTPKYKANIVKVKTKLDDIKAKESIQKTKCESIKSKQKNHRPKSTKKYVPVNRIKYNSFSDSIKTVEKVNKDAQKVPIGPNHLLNTKIFKQCIIKKIGGKEKKLSKTNIMYNGLKVIYLKIKITVKNKKVYLVRHK